MKNNIDEFKSDFDSFVINHDGKRGAVVKGRPICKEIVEFLEEATPYSLKQQLAVNLASGNVLDQIEEFDEDDDLL